MSFEPNKNLVPISVYRDTSAGNQLVVRYPAQKPIRPIPPKPSPILTLSNEPGTSRYALYFPPYYSQNITQPELPDSAYNSSRRLETPKMNQVGLLIDIYA